MPTALSCRSLTRASQPDQRKPCPVYQGKVNEQHLGYRFYCILSVWFDSHSWIESRIGKQTRDVVFSVRGLLLITCIAIAFSMADLDGGGEPTPPLSPFGRRTDAVTRSHVS